MYESRYRVVALAHFSMAGCQEQRERNCIPLPTVLVAMCVFCKILFPTSAFTGGCMFRTVVSCVCQVSMLT